MKTNREYRSVVEVRAKDEDYIVEGYATTFNQPYLLYRYGDFEVHEQVSNRAFDDCDMSDVIFQFDHEGAVFARTRNNTLSLTVDEKGLLVRANLGGTSKGRSLFEDIKGGYVDRMSFGFIVEEDTKEYTSQNGEDEKCLRTITKISKLYDVSAVSIPANDATTISARKFSDGVIAELEAERLLRARKLLELRMKLMKGE